MGSQQQVQDLGSLYVLYKVHSTRLQAAGYTKIEAFWLNFTCLPFLPWAESSESTLTLRQVLNLYLGIYQYTTGGNLPSEGVAAFWELLLDRYRMARKSALIEDLACRQIELGRFALPGEQHLARTARAGSIVLHTMAEWKRQTGADRLPCMLVEDTDIGGFVAQS